MMGPGFSNSTITKVHGANSKQSKLQKKSDFWSRVKFFLLGFYFTNDLRYHSKM